MLHLISTHWNLVSLMLFGSRIYRAAQEGLANVLRHSGATEVKLRIGSAQTIDPPGFGR